VSPARVTSAGEFVGMRDQPPTLTPVASLGIGTTTFSAKGATSTVVGDRSTATGWRLASTSSGTVAASVKTPA